MTDYLSAISTVGFPVVVTFYLLFRFEKKLSENTKVVNLLYELIKNSKRK
ncbi:MAG: YvrJ family protein [Parcubacteria group bacterium]|jgi:hypothetical protein|nr:YvrJ family protein [Parcubacteria group bacterium]